MENFSFLRIETLKTDPKTKVASNFLRAILKKTITSESALFRKNLSI
jgi:hypothetical protein